GPPSKRYPKYPVIRFMRKLSGVVKLLYVFEVGHESILLAVHSRGAALSGSRGETRNHKHVGKMGVMTLAAPPRNQTKGRCAGRSAMSVPTAHDFRRQTDSER